jgi:glycosyltransferase involved in cell wall biosynthesis
LLAASEAEGFGLPLIEAAKYGMPILARDIVVFKEIGQSNVSYFSADCGQDLKLEIEILLDSLAKGSQITSRELRISTWEQCSIRIKNFLKNRMDIDIPASQNIINK